MQKKLKPKVEGDVVRDENRIPLPQEGRDVTMTAFWEKRLLEGDVVEVVEAPAPARVKAEPKTETREKGGMQ